MAEAAGIHRAKGLDVCNDRLFPMTDDDLARMEHRATAACERAKSRDSVAYRLALDVLRLLDERRRLLVRDIDGGRGDGR